MSLEINRRDFLKVVRRMLRHRQSRFSSDSAVLSAGRRLLFLHHQHIADFAQPSLGRPVPDLFRRLQFGPLVNGTDTQTQHFWRPTDRRGIDGRTAIGAKGLDAFIAAFRDLDIVFQFPTF